MNAKTIDGFSITTIEQNSSLVGEEVGRVFLMRRHGHNWWGVGSVEIARELVRNAKTQTAEQFEATAEDAAVEV